MIYAYGALAFITLAGITCGILLRRPAFREGRGHHTPHVLAAAAERAEKAADEGYVSALRRARARMPVAPLTRARVTVAALHGAMSRQDWAAPSPRLQLPGGLAAGVPFLAPLPESPAGSVIRHREGCIPVVRFPAGPPWESAVLPAAIERPV